MPQLVTNEHDLRAAVSMLRQEGKSIGFVPTMGALHAGHLSLIEAAKAQCGAVITSIFVNPMQFGPNEDLDAYPRRLEEDRSKLDAAKTDLLFVPTVDTMYPEGFRTTVTVSGVSEGLCGDARPRHFAGVATVVCKLFNLVQPDVAFFGEKDYQQLQVIRRMVIDLSLPLRIVPIATVREADGLAMSSRNQYLDKKERKIAPAMYRTMVQVANKLIAGMDVRETLQWGVNTITEAGFDKIDYLEYRQGATLTPLHRYQPDSRLLCAAWLGGTRLIDNIAA